MISGKKLAFGLLVLVPLCLFALVAWAFFWPDVACSEPACARKRFDLFVELDSFRGFEPIALEVKTEQGTTSVGSILRSGGFDLTIVADDDTLPYSPDSGPLDRADLYQYALAWRNLAPPSRVDAKVYALVAPSIVSDRGERLFGIMFDSASREGVAIAPLETVRAFGKHEADAIPLLQLRTFVHEMLHALNRQHLDAIQMADGRITLEAPTRCITRHENGAWRLAEQPLMALSPSTIEFFQTTDPRNVLPGGSNTPFAGLRASATECADARSTSYERSVASRWEAARRRLFSVLGVASAEAQDILDEDEENTIIDDAPAPRLRLRIEAQEAAYPLGYPIALRLMVTNESEQTLPLKGRLAPAYRLVQVEYRFEGASEWRKYLPLAWFEPADDEEALLEAGGSTEQTAAIYFGDDGWTFPEPGAYEVRAILKPSEAAETAASNVIPIRVAAPESDAEREVLQPLLDEAGLLDIEVGRWLTFGGRIGNEQTQSELVRAIESHPDTALGSALRLTLATQRLRPPIDALTGERPPPDLTAAQALLQDTCTDSGIAALKHELLTRLTDELPSAMTNRLQSSAQAWDGIAASGETLRTYSDEALEMADVSLHFCRNGTALAGAPRAEAVRLARALQRERAQRIVLVGHTDTTGTCGFNDALGLHRAQAVKRLLMDAGIAGRRIQTVTLGERRPLDFGMTDEAAALNRRVDILVEREADESADEAAEDGEAEAEEVRQVRRALPRC